MDTMPAARRLVVVWQVNGACTLACPFCRFSRDLSLDRRAVSGSAVLRLGAVLAGVQRESRSPVHLSFLGGEPFRWKPLAAVARTMRVDQHLSLGITTNGLALAAPAVRQLVTECFDRLTVSVDAPGEVHDELRGRRGIFAGIREAIAALVRERKARGNALSIVVNTVLMKETVGRFPELCRELAAWGIDEITFNQLGGRDRPEFHRRHKLTPADVTELRGVLPALRQSLAQHGIALAGGQDYLERISASAAGQRIPVHHCHPGEEFLFIDRFGLVAPCAFTADLYGVNVDSLRSPADLMALPGRFRAMKHRCFSVECADCPSTQTFDKFDRTSAEKLAASG